MVQQVKPPTRTGTGGLSPARPKRSLALVVVCIGAMMTFVNVSSTIAGLALIQDDLHASPTETVWITSAYSLVVASLILAFGSLSDLFGRRAIFMGGTVFFAGGSMIAFASSNTGFLIAGQAIMGIGGAAVLPSSLSVVSHLFVDARRRAEAVSIWAGSSGIGLAVGPLASGALLQHYSWHSIFLTNVTLGVVAFVGAVLFVPASRHHGRRLDSIGVALGTVAVASSTFAIIEGKSIGYMSTEMMVVYAVFAVALVAFGWYEARHDDPMIDVGLFRSVSFSTVMTVAATTMFGFTGVCLLVVLYLQHVQGVSPLGVGIRMMTLFAPFIIVSAVAGKIAHRLGFKITLTVGLAVMATGIYAMRVTPAGPGFSHVCPSLVIIGLGAGLLVAPSTAAAVISVDQSQAGMASSMVNMFRQLGNVLGASVVGTIVTTRFASGLGDRLSGHRLPQHTVDAVVTAAQRGDHSATGLPAEVTVLIADSARRAFTDATHMSAVIAAVTVAAVTVPALLFVRQRPTEPETRRPTTDESVQHV